MGPINAINDEGYIVDVSGVEFKMPNSFSQDEILFDEDNTNSEGDYVHIYGVDFTDGSKIITISTSTRYDEPFKTEDALDALGDEKVIAGKKGKYYEPEKRFGYVENGVSVMIKAPDIGMIEYCINTTSS